MAAQESINTTLQYPDALIDRFWKYVNKGQVNECWEWNGSLMKRGGYGQLRYNLKTLKSHRLSYEINVGKVPEGKFICHKCGNSKCCNPNHLYAGTPKENWHDAIKHSTAYKLPPINPQDVHCAKINYEIANDIRNSNEGGPTLSKKYNISRTMISKIKRNLAWKI
jgi:hypothetical protein